MADTNTISEWNKAAAELGLGLFWAQDANGSNTPDANEVNDIAGIYKDAKGRALPAFARDVALVDQLLTGKNPKVLSDSQRALLRKEAGFRTVAMRETYLDATHYSADERRMALHLLRAARHLEDAYLWQVDPKNLEYKRAVYAQGDALAIRHFVATHGPHCLRVKDPECSALPSHPAITPGAHLYLKGMTPAEFLKLPDRLRSPYAGLEKKGDQVVAVPFADHAELRPILEAAARELHQAAGFARAGSKASKAEKQGMAAFKTYLIEVSKALTSTQVERPFHKAHEAWAKIPADFKWAFQFGPMETIAFDGINGHYGYQAYFGVTTAAVGSSMKAIEHYGIQRMENDLAALLGIPPRSIPNDAVNRVRVVDPIMVAGNARPPFGSVGGFAGPNDEMFRLSWVLMNENKETLRRMKANITTHFGERYANFLEIGLATFNTAIHEQTHKLVTQRLTEIMLASGEKRTAISIFGEEMWSQLDECKTSIAPFWFAPRFAAVREISDETRDGLNMAQLNWVFFMLNQPLKNGESLNTYPVLATMILGQWVATGALTWNKGLGLWDVKLDDVADSLEALLKDVADKQAKGDKKGALALVEKTVQDEKLLAIRKQVQEKNAAAGMPPPMTTVYAVGMDE